MNNLKLLMKTFLIVAVASLSLGCDKEKMVPVADLPVTISSYVSTNFPNNNIVSAKKENKSYELLLDGNIKLEFKKKNEIVDIDGVSKLPDSVIPQKILSYVNANYAGRVIIGWEIENKNQQVELDNGLDLEFNMNGDFLRIDH